MYKRILIPTDGSKLARKGIKAGIALAKASGASVVAYYAVEPIERIWYTAGAGVRPSEVAAAEKQLRAEGEMFLEEVRKAAAAANVPCKIVLSAPGAPYQGIIDTARRAKCDLVCMASHGRSKIASALLGNVTHKVLTHSKVPVLVCR